MAYGDLTCVFSHHTYPDLRMSWYIERHCCTSTREPYLVRALRSVLYVTWYSKELFIVVIFDIFITRNCSFWKIEWFVNVRNEISAYWQVIFLTIFGCIWNLFISANNENAKFNSLCFTQTCRWMCSQSQIDRRRFITEAAIFCHI